MNAPELRFLGHTPSLTLRDRIDNNVFNALYARSLVYNTCWEDPAVDRRALQLGADDTVMVISSAGCNALDYALDGPERIHAVDANPRQNALLELKIAAIRRLEFEDFFAIFGDGHHPRFAELYRDCLRAELSDFARDWWDRHAGWFTSPLGSFYYHGLSGLVARAFRTYFRLRPRLSGEIRDLFESDDLASQRAIYDQRIAPALWTPAMKWVLGRQFTMSLLGVPHPQRRLVQAQHEDGVAGFVREAIEYVFRQLPVADNYFWRVYLNGRYTPECCPEYLKPDNFQALKGGLVNRISTHTCTVTEFLHGTRKPISRFVLLDHMDWMSSYHPSALVEEWNAILNRARSDARILLRSAHEDPAFLHWVRVGPWRQPLDGALRFERELAARLHRDDRVHTYAGFMVADVAG
ncbi:MAG: BtaA family protein [Gallionellaceae bacterium]|nr:BtaA family protein [Gallionellaceae bacterium]